MTAHSLADRLERDDEARTVNAFPDGSVDTFYAVRAAGERLNERGDFAEVVESGDPEVVTLEREAVDPGGHAANAAAQADRLGNHVTLAGHLDAPAFEDLPFETVSMGEPTSVTAFGFEDGDLLAVENSPDVVNWTLDDLDAALGDGVEEFLTADAVVCANWTSIDGLPAALSDLADRALDGGRFVLDPGSVAGKSDRDVARLFDAVERLTDGYDVVLAANEREVRSLAGAIGESADDADAALESIRRAVDLDGAVLHAVSRAAVATADGVTSVENFDVDPARHTGGGDRFDAGLAHALARGWGWEDALLLGNACASRYVATGETGGIRALARFLRDRT